MCKTWNIQNVTNCISVKSFLMCFLGFENWVLMKIFGSGGRSERILEKIVS